MPAGIYHGFWGGCVKNIKRHATHSFKKTLFCQGRNVIYDGYVDTKINE